MKSIIRLFNSVLIENPKLRRDSKDILATTIHRGFIFSPMVVGNHTDRQLRQLITVVEEEIGLTPEQMNATFHKSWHKVATASMFQLVAEQIIHYITTYGYEYIDSVLGTNLYSADTIYIPAEKLKIPKINEGKIKLTVIHGITKGELKEKILKFLTSGIALKEQTITDVVEICDLVGLVVKDLNVIKNKEIKCILYDRLKIYPENPVEFLRYMIYKATGKTLLIKNDGTIERIKENAHKCISEFCSYPDTKRLGEIFYRFKPLFLAFKATQSLKCVINKIRKYARLYHKPMPEDYLNSVTKHIRNGTIRIAKLKEALSKVNTFRKIRLLYALQYRTAGCESILYKIRNGKSYATETDVISPRRLSDAIYTVRRSIAFDLVENVHSKKIYFDEKMVYALPATEKMFTGNIPSGSYIKVDKDVIIAVYWENVNGKRVDLDFSFVNEHKIGWDAAYRSARRDILFSGDNTDATRGATEALYIKNTAGKCFSVMLNYFNYRENEPVPFKLFIARDKPTFPNKNYMVHPNKVELVVPSEIAVKQKTLGYLMAGNKEVRFYFNESAIGSSITSSNNEFMKHAREFMRVSTETVIPLRELLLDAGAVVVDKPEDADIDLSIENLQRDTILKLLI